MQCIIRPLHIHIKAQGLQHEVLDSEDVLLLQLVEDRDIVIDIEDVVADLSSQE